METFCYKTSKRLLKVISLKVQNFINKSKVADYYKGKYSTRKHLT